MGGTRNGAVAAQLAAGVSSASEFWISLLFFSFSTGKKITRGKEGSAAPSWGWETGRTFVFLLSVLKSNNSAYNRARDLLGVRSLCPARLPLGPRRGWSPERQSEHELPGQELAPSALLIALVAECLSR